MSYFDIAVLAWIGLALVLFPIQLLVTAPYGRHVHSGWGPRISNRLGWSAMEFVSLVVFAALFLTGPVPKAPPAWIFFALWMAHYANRSLIYPWRTRTSGKTIPLAIVASATVFNVINAGLNGYYLGWLTPYPQSWLMDIRFIVGLILFVFGAAANLGADDRLISLRSASTEYAIPCGSLFEHVSCPNHLGEIVEWLGFALMCWSLPALSFAIWTAANLIPRALSHHRWYAEKFANYPKGRKALIPFVM